MEWESLNTSRYYEFIEKIIVERGQWNIPDGEYWEGHHIMPVCKGGSGVRNNRSKHVNVIWLYPEEHYKAHEILFEDNEHDIQLALAWQFISDKHKISMEEYGKLKKQLSLLISKRMSGENNPMYGKKRILSEETKRKISESTKGKNNPMYGKGYKLKGRKFSEEHRKKIGNAVRGEKNGMYGKTGAENPFYGRHHAESSILKFSTPLHDLTTGKYYKSIKDAYTDLNISKYVLMRHLQGKFTKKLKHKIIKTTAEEYLKWKNTQN